MQNYAIIAEREAGRPFDTMAETTEKLDSNASRDRGGAEAMAGRIVRFADLKQHGTPVMFIDSVLPGHYRMNYAVIGDTASENPDFTPMISVPHRFQIGMFEAPPGNGPGWHTHQYVELFVPLTGRWRFCWGDDPERPDDLLGDAVLEPWDTISFPPGLWRRFENVSETNSWGFAVLDPHDHFSGPDPQWPAWLVREAAAKGFRTDELGRMIKPDDISAIEAEVVAALHRAPDAASGE